MRLCSMSLRVRKWYERATAEQIAAGEDWYPAARKWCVGRARKHGYTLAQVAGVVAALSPMRDWKGNKTVAERALAAHKAGLHHNDVKLSFGPNNEKAWRILDGEQSLDVLGGRKVRAFYRNIMGEHEHVTVDRWAWRVCTDDEYTGVPTDRHYDVMQRAYKNAAERLNTEPATVQAVTWVAIKEA